MHLLPRTAVGAVLAAVAVSLLACGPGASSSPTMPAHGASVEVLYAGSLVNLMEHDLGPRFSAATGYRFTGFAGGSAELANQIKARLRAGDVFVSASPAVNGDLEGPANGSWVRWYYSFASTSLVLGYDPHSSFAPLLRSHPWYEVVTRPGFRLGRTDPALDPKGKLSVEALDDAASALRLPDLEALSRSTAGVFPEETLVGRLQSGQLDAGFFYSNEAREQGIPTVSLAPVHLAANYTVTVLERAPDAAGGQAFVAYLLGAGGRATLASHGIQVIVPPRLAGAASVLPPSLRPRPGDPN